MTRPYQQIRDVLAHAREIYRRLRSELHQHASNTSDDRTRTVLEDVGREHNATIAMLKESVSHGDARLLETWIQYIPDEEAQRHLDELRFTPEMGPDDVVAQKAEVDEAIVELFRRVSEQSSAPRIEEFFERLITQLEQRQKNLSWHVRDSDSAPARERPV